jgi:hypothetical protein
MSYHPVDEKKKPRTSAHGLYDSFEGNDDQRAADAPAA